ncbi:uncharacterized protein LOC124886596 [Capsicum annuum]|uniref:uncharacterized protein LOC124886596 n=1 Tax=Capsicum annuum TaxID=4072 RepID=UPI001FB0B6B1|nr:uncharacterized protein LOC124886596 [Capsicum annuum]
MHGGFGFGDRNGERVALLDFARAFGMVVVNSSFLKKEDHLITFRSALAKTQIDFLLLRKRDKVLCKTFKVIPSDHLSTQHRLLVMDLFIKKSRKSRVREGQPRIKWGSLTPVSALKIRVMVAGMGPWECRGDIDGMWDTTANCIKETAREVLGVSRGQIGRHKGNWWWNEEVKKKVKTKKEAYVKMIESKDKKEKRVNREAYKVIRMLREKLALGVLCDKNNKSRRDIDVMLVPVKAREYINSTMMPDDYERGNDIMMMPDESKRGSSFLDYIPIVCELPNMFPTDLPGMPPDCEIEFVVDLDPGTRPIFMEPYCMAPAELKELNSLL